MSKWIVGVAGMLLLGTDAARGADWPAFRGPTGDGVAGDSKAPITWAIDQHVAWKTPMPGPGNGSPIVLNRQVIVTSAEDPQGKQRSLLSFDALTGEQQWKQTVVVERHMPTHKTNPYSGSTPVSDGEMVVVWHATGGLHAYTMEGQPVWHRDLGTFEHIWGYASSPIIHDGKVILHSGPGKVRIFVAAFDVQTGKQLWLTEEAFTGDGDYNANKQYQGSWATPVVANDLIVVTQPTRIVAYHPDDGSIVWFCKGVSHARGDLAYSSPTIADNVCVVTGGFHGPMLAVPMEGHGDITDKRLWRFEKQPQSIGSSVHVDGFLYRPNAGPGGIQCIEVATGVERWMDRSVRGDYWASIIRVGDLLYATNQDATTVVFKANPERFEQVAVNHLKERCNATPSVADGFLYFRTYKYLICVKP